jgi:hypothetical protein
MNRWKRKIDDEDDTLTFDDLDDLDDLDDAVDDEPKKKRRPYLPPRPIRTHFSYEEGDLDEDDTEQNRFDEIEAKIRAGSYKPTKSDPWNAHVLYDMLRSLGEV